MGSHLVPILEINITTARNGAAATPLITSSSMGLTWSRLSAAPRSVPIAD